MTYKLTEEDNKLLKNVLLTHNTPEKGEYRDCKLIWAILDKCIDNFKYDFKTKRLTINNFPEFSDAYFLTKDRKCRYYETWLIPENYDSCELARSLEKFKEIEWIAEELEELYSLKKGSLLKKQYFTYNNDAFEYKNPLTKFKREDIEIVLDITKIEGYEDILYVERRLSKFRYVYEKLQASMLEYKENSAKVIQRYWRECRYNPEYKMCEKIFSENIEAIPPPNL